MSREGTGRGAGAVALRYDDVLQDGRIALSPLAVGLGAAVWPHLLADPSAVDLRRHGILPILVHLVLEGSDVRVPATAPLAATGTWWTWTARSADGAVDRIVLSMTVELTGRPGSTYGGFDPHAAPVVVGKVHADHVFTRPFASAGERRVDALPGGNPPDGGRLRAFGDVGADTVEALPPVPVAFALPDTDSNNHVNSLVYLRRFEQTFAATHPNAALRRVELAWRKPCFAGDGLRLDRWRTADGVAGVFVDAEGVPRCRLAGALG